MNAQATNFHPLANLLPLLEGEPFDEMVADIHAKGLLEPIALHEGLVLDGRNRLRACKAADVEPRFVTFEGDDPLAFVLSRNVHRRHLDESQRAMIAARIANMRRGGDRRSCFREAIDARRARGGAGGKAAGAARAALRRHLRRSAVAVRAVQPLNRHGSRRRQPLFDDDPGRDQGARRRVDRRPRLRAVPMGDCADAAAALDVMAAWGFAYRSNFVWVKGRTGTGYWSRNQHELLLIGVKLDIPAPAPGTQWLSLIEAPVMAHSRKPDEARRMIDAMFPNLPKVELFARSCCEGWDVWGQEAEDVDDPI